jgi:hypothetical protein
VVIDKKESLIRLFGGGFKKKRKIIATIVRNIITKEKATLLTWPRTKAEIKLPTA